MEDSAKSDQKKGGFSFSIKKRKEKQIVTKSSIDERTENEREKTDFILGIEKNKIESTEPAEEKKELVIPLINKNKWLGPDDGETTPPRKKTKTLSAKKPVVGETGSKLDDEALQELMKESRNYNESWESRDKEDSSLAIPLLMVNKPPDGFETDDKLDVSIRPDAAEEADYDQIPIESFGKAMLRGMGWKETEGIGNKMKKVVAPIEAVIRPKGQGLGAETGPKKNAVSKSKDMNGTDEAEGFVKGASVLVTKGPHKNLYGLIEGVDEDNARLMVKLAISGQMITLSQFSAQSVTRSEYKKYARDLGKFSKGHDELKKRKDKEESDLRTDKNRRSHDKHGSDRNRSHDQSPDRETSKHRHKDGDRTGHSSDNESKSSQDRYKDGGSKSSCDKHKNGDSRSSHDKHKERSSSKDTDRDSGRSYDKKRRREEPDRGDDRKSKYERSPESDSSRTKYWLRPDLRVRFIDKTYKSGKYYNSKVQVIDVQERDVCSCRTDEGKLLHDIQQSMLETLIPKGEPGYVMVVQGKHKGQVGTVLTKDKKRCEADVQMLRDRDQIVRLGYDYICEYAGDIHLAEDL